MDSMLHRKPITNALACLSATPSFMQAPESLPSE